MFGKWMNNYYYGKSGKGDYKKEDLPTTRWQLFWEMLRVRLSALVRLNLLYAVAWLPAMIVLMIYGLNVVMAINNLAAETTELVYTGEQLRAAFSNMTLSMLLWLTPCIAITGIVTPGLAYVTRNWARDEHAFVWSDFKDAVKANWKQGLGLSAITGIMPLVLFTSYEVYGAMAAENAFMVVPQVLVLMIGLVWGLCITYMHPLVVSYKLSFKNVLRNGLLLGVARLPMSFAIRLLHCVPMIIGVGLMLVVDPMYCILGLFAYYVLIGFGLSRFITASYTNGVFDKYINSRIEGATVNRGLNTEVDDDEYEDEELEDDLQA